MIFTFPGQREGEDVLMIIHKHPIVYAKIVIAFIIIVVLPVIFFLYFWLATHTSPEFHQANLIAGIFTVIYFLYGLVFTCIRWIDEEFDVFIITTDRLIDVTQVTFFKRSVASTPLEQIQDTTGEIHGFFPTIFHYGNLTVQTAAGQASDFFIDRIPDPEGVARKLLDWTREKREKAKITSGA
ncbi:hypothetical protein JW752_02415 [Candidatus Peregrinibacteria bacterium]|nr:hypothetical protein [Candidatus Peregrinibacteria bacterium]